jgi:hypothetical protein
LKQNDVDVLKYVMMDLAEHVEGMEEVKDTYRSLSLKTWNWI